MEEKTPIEEFEERMFEQVKHLLRKKVSEDYRKYLKFVAEKGDPIRLLPDSPRKVMLKREHLKEIADMIGECENEREMERLLGRESWRKYREAKEPVEKRNYLHEARRHWGIAGWKTRLIRRYYGSYRDFWMRELARETKLDYIGRDTEGRSIYYDTVRQVYVGLNEKGEVIVEEGKRLESPELQVDMTVAVETEGHDNLICEVTTSTKVMRLTRKALDDIEKGIQTQLDKFLKMEAIVEKPELKKMKAVFKYVKMPAVKKGIEYRIKLIPDVPPFPKAFTVIARSSELYPEWREYPAFGVLQTDLKTLKIEKFVEARRLESTWEKRKKEEEKEKAIERLKRKGTEKKFKEEII